ncbi:MAG: hypothetical protein Q8M03_03665 [Legionella sp.]|nr:hypothetical protein [Legionella sp.]
MDIILQGRHTGEEAAENLISALRLFKERYHIEQFREIHLTVTLVDSRGDDVELVDSETAQVYRTVEIYATGHELTTGRRPHPMLKLVIDNTR